MTEKISRLIDELLAYGVNAGLVDKEDETYTRNKLLELFEEQEYIEAGVSNNEAASCGTKTNERQLSEILDDMLSVLYEKKIMPEDTITYKDLFDTKIMGLLTPAPSVIRREFASHLAKSPKEATDYYYDFSRATNYIRVDRIKKDEKWQTSTEFGDLDITINLSKPEKDPRDIAKAGQAKKSGCYAGKMKAMRDIFHILPDRIIVSYRLHLAEKTTIFSILLMCITMSTV